MAALFTVSFQAKRAARAKWLIKRLSILCCCCSWICESVAEIEIFSNLKFPFCPIRTISPE